MIRLGGPARRAVATRMLVSFAAERGVPPERTLHGTGLAAGELADPATLVEADQELLAIRNVLRALGPVPGLGAELGSRFSVGNHGDVGFALMTSSTVGDALARGLRYQSLSDAYVRVMSEERDGELVLRLDAAALPAELRDFLVERDVTAIAATLGAILPSLRIRIELALAPQRVAAVAAACPGHTVGPGPADVLRVPAAALGLPLPFADETVARTLERRLRDQLRPAASTDGRFAVRVRAALLDALPHRLTATETARRLHVAPRTLRRRLLHEGSTFQALADDSYAHVACELLERGTPVTTVADHLGYAEPASFSRAFRRWTGTPPSRWDR